MMDATPLMISREWYLQDKWLLRLDTCFDELDLPCVAMEQFKEDGLWDTCVALSLYEYNIVATRCCDFSGSRRLRDCDMVDCD